MRASAWVLGVIGVLAACAGPDTPPFDPSTAALEGDWIIEETTVPLAGSGLNYQGGTCTGRIRLPIPAGSEREGGVPSRLVGGTVHCTNGAGRSGTYAHGYTDAGVRVQRRADSILVTLEGGFTPGQHLYRGSFIAADRLRGVVNPAVLARDGGWTAERQP